MKKIFILPTDTVYGIFTRIGNIKEKKKIFEIKKRDKAKPLCVYISKLNEIKPFCDQEVLENTLSFLKTILPGPFTVILPTNQKIPFVTKGRKIGIRLTEDKRLNNFIVKHGILCGTSFNLSNEPDIYVIEHEDELKHINTDSAEIVKGSCIYNQSSLILEWKENNEFIIKRKNDQMLDILKNRIKNQSNISLKEDKIILS